LTPPISGASSPANPISGPSTCARSGTAADVDVKVVKRRLSAEGLNWSDVIWERTGTDVAYTTPSAAGDPG
jgi:hypothetical protein